MDVSWSRWESITRGLDDRALSVGNGIEPRAASTALV